MNNTQIENLRQARHILNNVVDQLENEGQEARNIGDIKLSGQLCDESDELILCISRLRWIANDIDLNS